jgi:hypothetical protein
MHNHSDAQNADLFYIEKNTTLQLLFCLNGDSGSSRPPSGALRKHMKPPAHPEPKLTIYVNDPDQYHNALLVLPNDKIDQLKERLEARVNFNPPFQRLYLRGEQLDDDLTLNEYDIVPGTTLQILYVIPPKKCERHDKNHNDEHLMQKLDPKSQKWIWVCRPDTICIMGGPNQNSAGASSNVITQHPTTPRAKRTTLWSKHAKQDTTAVETPSGAHHQTPLLDTSTPLSIGTRVYARFSDNIEYPTTIQGRYTGGHIVIFDIEGDASYRIANDRIRPLHPPPTLTTSDSSSPEHVLCGLHNSSRNISNLK